MKSIILAFAGVVLAIFGTAGAQLDPGAHDIAKYKLTDADNNIIGYAYVPDSLHSQWGEDIWVWKDTPWDKKFTFEYVSEVTSYSVPSGWTEETYEGGKLTSAAVPSGTLNYNWKVVRGSSTVEAYLDYSTSQMDWWSPTGVTYLSKSETYTFTPVTGTISSSAISTGIESDSL